MDAGNTLNLFPQGRRLPCFGRGFGQNEQREDLDTSVFFGD